MLPDSVTRQAVGNFALGQSDLAGERPVDVDVKLRIVKDLLDTQVGDAGNGADALEERRGIGIVGLLVIDR